MRALGEIHTGDTMTTMNLELAKKEGVILNDVLKIAIGCSAMSQILTFRGIATCPCGWPLILHIETIRREEELTLLYDAISGEYCPDCDSVLSRSTVSYAGIYSAGWPLMPATPISAAELYIAIDRLRLGKENSTSANVRDKPATTPSPDVRTGRNS